MPNKNIRERNVYLKNPREVDVLVGFCYPSTYRAGMSGLATHLFYSAINQRPDSSCERYFRFDVPSPERSLESRRSLCTNHLLGFSLAYEENVLSMIQMLETGGISAWAINRTKKDPIVIAGGPAVSANPEPFAEFLDAVVIGDGDYVIHKIIEEIRNGGNREEIIERLSKLDGVYVPQMFPKSVKRLIVKNLDDAFHPTEQIIPDVPEGDKLEPVFGKSLLVEVTRGCGHSCKFCLIGHVCRPRRTRSLHVLKEIIRKGIKKTDVRKISLIGSSIGDMDSVHELATWIVESNLSLSIPSVRADQITMELLQALIKGGQQLLTIAPETGSEELRKSIGKHIDNQTFEQVGEMAAEAGFKSIKLYFIVGLPDETIEDVKEIPRFVKRISKVSCCRLIVSVNPFVPKAHTRLERMPQPKIEEIRHRLRIVQKGLQNVSRCELEVLDPRKARIQAALSLGDRSISKVIWLAAQYGGFGGWRRAEKETGIDFFKVANDKIRLQGRLPWEFIKI